MTTLTEQLRQEVIAITPPEHFVADVGAMAVQTVVPVEQPPTYNMTPRQLVMLGLLSHGNTLTQAAERVHVTRKQAHREKENIQKTFSASNMASVVHLAISAGLLHIDKTSDVERTDALSNFDAATLNLYSQGVSNDQIAGAVQKNPKVIMRHEKALFEKLGAWTRPHAVRRGHELGVLAVKRF